MQLKNNLSWFFFFFDETGTMDLLYYLHQISVNVSRNLCGNSSRLETSSQSNFEFGKEQFFEIGKFLI